MKKQILLCVAGMTPQIITETLWALVVENGEHIDEIRVITTLAGKRRLVETLFGETGKFHEFCREFGTGIKFDESTITQIQRPDGESLEDIRTAEDNEIAGNEISRIVRELCKRDDTRIHASVAGGRKTMSVYLAAAMSMFGRADDCLSHILVSEEFETHLGFFYKPKTPVFLTIADRTTGEARLVSTDDAEIHLAEIPYVRLRGAHFDLLDDRDSKFSAAVAKTQEELKILEANYNLQIHLGKRQIRIGSRTATLSERQFFVFVMFVNLLRKQFAEQGFTQLDAIPAGEFDEVCRMISRASSDGELGIDEFGGLKRGEFLQTLCVELYSVKMPRLSPASARSDVSRALREVISKIKKRLRDSGFPDEFLIVNKNSGQRAKSPCFGIGSHTNRFRFVDRSD